MTSFFDFDGKTYRLAMDLARQTTYDTEYCYRMLRKAQTENATLVVADGMLRIVPTGTKEVGN